MTTNKFIRSYLLAVAVLASFTLCLFVTTFARITPAEATTCNEDEACWDWTTMGNHTRCDSFDDTPGLFVCQHQGEGGLAGWTIWLEQR